MAQVERDEQDMLQYGGGRSLLGQNLKECKEFVEEIQSTENPYKK